MYHRERGMTTIEIWQEEERQKRTWESRRKQQYQRLAYAFAALIRLESESEADIQAQTTAAHDMIEEGGPLYDNEQGGHDD